MRSYLLGVYFMRKEIARASVWCDNPEVLMAMLRLDCLKDDGLVVSFFEQEDCEVSLRYYKCLVRFLGDELYEFNVATDNLKVLMSGFSPLCSGNEFTVDFRDSKPFKIGEPEKPTDEEWIKRICTEAFQDVVDRAMELAKRKG